MKTFYHEHFFTNCRAQLTSYRRIVSLEETENTGYVPDEN